MNLIARENLYDDPTTSPSNPINNTPIINQSSGDFSFSSGFNNFIYYLALFALIWSIYYFCINAYQYKYFSLTKKAKEYEKEWRGLDHWVANYRILWTLLVLQFPLIFFYFGASDPTSSFFFGIIFLFMFVLKLILDATHIFKLKDYMPTFANLPIGKQITQFFGNILKALQAPKEKKEAPKAIPSKPAPPKAAPPKK
jgi:hypothetical protein